MMYSPLVKRLLFPLLGGIFALSSCSHDDKHDASTSNSGGGSTTSGDSTASGGATGGTTSSATGGSGGASTGGSGGSAGAPVDFVEPELLSETGLYEEDMETLAPGVREFHPKYFLWSDGATKRRWIYLPPDTTIDTSDMDFWVYPIGTKLWKEFTRDGVRVETRIIEKIDEGEWFAMAFQWNEEQTDAEAVPRGLLDASGTEHDIPSTSQCENCHVKMQDMSLGFTAIQLSHDDEDSVTLSDLIDEGLLSDPPAGNFVIPGDETESAALGYLHANCGNCHNPTSFITNMVDMRLWLDTTLLDSVEETPTYTSTVDVPSVKSLEEVGYETGGEGGQPGLESFRIVAGQPDESVLFLRVSTRITAAQMPPIGTEIVDEDGVAVLRDFIEGL